MVKYSVSLFVSLTKMALVSGIIVKDELYHCDGRDNRIKLPVENCKYFELSHNNKKIYSEDEGFISPIISDPTKGDFLVEGCPEIVYVCNTYDGDEIRITYTGAKINLPPPRGREHIRKNTIRTLIIGLCCTLLIVIGIIIISWWCYQRRGGHQQVPNPGREP